jgi:methylenetetrahydrofolate dehydrogenase (NADP+) / methenyltetrahydrofolate cyclohydrolase
MIIDGKDVSKGILAGLKQRVAQLKFIPKMVDVVVGDDPVTESYVNIKSKRAREVGIDFEVLKFPADITQEQLQKEVRDINQTQDLCGILVQLPLPEHINRQLILDTIDSLLDVDVITTENLGRLFAGVSKQFPPTASAILHILKTSGVDLVGSNILVIGSGDLVGKPTAFMLMAEQATVTIANASTKNLKTLCASADVIISGTGVPGLVKAGMVKPDHMIIDAGTAESGSGIAGDVDFETVSQIARLVTPVPGGVGPVTVAMLLKNVVENAEILNSGKN